MLTLLDGVRANSPSQGNFEKFAAQETKKETRDNETLLEFHNRVFQYVLRGELPALRTAVGVVQ